GLPAADDHEAGAGHRVQRLDPAALDRRQPGELVQAHRPVVALRGRGGDEIDPGRGNDQPGEVAGKGHRAALRRRNPIKCMPKWISIPPATIAHEKYGSSQPGLRTTCKTVPSSPGKNPDW